MHFPCCYRIACKSNVAEGSWGVNEFWTKRGCVVIGEQTTLLII